MSMVDILWPFTRNIPCKRPQCIQKPSNIITYVMIFDLSDAFYAVDTVATWIIEEIQDVPISPIKRIIIRESWLPF